MRVHILLLAWAALAVAPALCAPTVLPVSTAPELLDALPTFQSLNSPNVTIQLRTDIVLSPADLAGYSTPFLVPGNRTLWLQGADSEGLRTLDFGDMPSLLNVQPGGMLGFDSLNVNGTADQAAPPAGVNVTAQLAIWPTVTFDPGSLLEFRDSNITLHPSAQCSPDTIRAAVAQFQLAPGATNASVWADGLTGHFVNFSLAVPLLDVASNTRAGTVWLTTVSTNMTCTPLLASSSGGSTNGSSSSSSSSGDSSSSPPSWVWVVVGVGAALVAATAAGAIVWRRRRLQAQQGKQGGDLLAVGVEISGSGHHIAGENGSSAGVGGEGAGVGSSPSSTLNVSAHTLGSNAAALQPWHGGSMADSLWKSRMGVIEGLQLGGVLGRGAYGHVYRGRWKGAQVAVKVVPTHVGQGVRVDLGHEPLLSMALSHPNVLASYKMCVVRLLPEAAEPSASDAGPLDSGSLQTGSVSSLAGEAGASGAAGRHGSTAGAPGSPGRSSSSAGGAASLGEGGAGGGQPSPRQVVPSLTEQGSLVEVMPSTAVLPPGLYETWLVSELADRGSLADALAAGWFRQGDPPTPDLTAILLCLLDIARGLEYLHSCNILHGDLKPQNCLLRTARADRRGYVCKLADFGLSRLLGDQQTHVDTGSYGTASHAAPELLTTGRLTRASDVYALGCIAQELVAGRRLFEGMPTLQIICLVTQQGHMPPIPPDCPPALADLMQRCWHAEPQMRPDASTIVRELIACGASLPRAGP